MARFLVVVACATLAVVTNAQVPNGIQTRTGPPLVDRAKDREILSIGGWWIKVDAEATTTEKIGWEFGKNPESLGWWMSWRRPPTRDGRIPERLLYSNLPVSAWVDLQPIRVIYVRASTRRETDSASFCVFYQLQPVARIDFVGETTTQLDATSYEPLCEP